jgi:hypothetical protein
VSKKTSYITLFILVLILLAAASKSLLQTKTSYQSKAATPRKTYTSQKTPKTYKNTFQQQKGGAKAITIDPNQIIRYWSSTPYKSPKIDVDRDAAIKAFLAHYNPYIQNLLLSQNYLGDIKFMEDYSGSTGTACKAIGLPVETSEPFGIFLRDATDPLNTEFYNAGFKSTRSITVSFYETSSSISLVATSWDTGSNNTTGMTPVAVRYFSYDSIVNAFSSILAEYETPLKNEEVSWTDRCDGRNYKKWTKWAKYLWNDTSAMNVPPYGAPTPTPNMFQKRSADQYQVSTKISDFMKAFTKAFKPHSPETVIYPFLEKKTKSTTSAVTFTNIIDPARNKAWYFDKGYQLQHFTYYLDKCPANSVSGSFYTLKDIYTPIWKRYIESDGTDQKKPNWVNDDVTYVMQGKTFINIPYNPGYFVEGGTKSCTTDNRYDSIPNENFCPPISKDISFSKENSFFLTLKAINDSSCNYTLDQGILGMNDDNTITLLIHLDP